MESMELLTVSDAFRERVRVVADRLGPITLVVEPKWHGFAAHLGVDTAATQGGTALVVGTPAFVLRHARSAVDDFGFVMPVARITKPWRRGMQWRDNSTLDLWSVGFTPVDLDRLLVDGDNAMFEFVVGNARQTPAAPDTSL